MRYSFIIRGPVGVSTRNLFCAAAWPRAFDRVSYHKKRLAFYVLADGKRNVVRMKSVGAPVWAESKTYCVRNLETISKWGMDGAMMRTVIYHTRRFYSFHVG